LTLLLYIALATQFYRLLGAPGISLSDTIVFTAEAALLLILLNRKMVKAIDASGSLVRAFLAASAGGAVVWLLIGLFGGMHPFLQSTLAMGAGTLAAVPFIWPELRLLLRL